MERIDTELHNICTGYITFARSINTDTLHLVVYPRQFTQGAVKGKQFSDVYRVYTSSIGTIFNSWSGMERIVTELHNICTGYITFARSINTDTLHLVVYPRQFTQGAVKGKQFSDVYRVYTSSIGTISNS